MKIIGLTNRGYVSGNIAETVRGGSHGAIPQVLESKCYAVDARNGVINECVNGTLQCKEHGYNFNSNNDVLET